MLSYFLDAYKTSFKKKIIENEYYDTDYLDILNLSYMLRVRLNENTKDLTLKVPLKKRNGDSEYHQILTEEEYINLKEKNIFPKGKIKDILLSDNIDINNIKYKTTLNCIRYEFYEDDYIIVLDKNRYDNVLDFNIEIESSSYEKSLNKNLELSKLFNYSLKEDYKTKYRRALIK